MKAWWFIVLALGAIAGLSAPQQSILAPVPVQARTVNACIDSCFNEFSTTTCNYPNCEDLRRVCLQQCNDEQRNQSPQSGPYGAIAFSINDGGEAISYDAVNQRDANDDALMTCRAHGDNCRIVGTYANACAALAVAEGAVHYATGSARTLRQAEAQALTTCRRSWGRCEVDLSSCSPTR